MTKELDQAIASPHEVLIITTGTHEDWVAAVYSDPSPAFCESPPHPSHGMDSDIRFSDPLKFFPVIPLINHNIFFGSFFPLLLFDH